MKEIVKSKGMICFILFVLGASYFNTCNVNNNVSLENQKIISVIAQ